MSARTPFWLHQAYTSLSNSQQQALITPAAPLQVRIIWLADATTNGAVDSATVGVRGTAEGSKTASGKCAIRLGVRTAGEGSKTGRGRVAGTCGVRGSSEGSCTRLGASHGTLGIRGSEHGAFDTSGKVSFTCGVRGRGDGTKTALSRCELRQGVTGQAAGRIPPPATPNRIRLSGEECSEVLSGRRRVITIGG